MTGSKLVRDKNKSTFKLKGLPHIYWINLDSDVTRKEWMEDQFDYWEIENHTRISGYDGREDDPSSHLKGRIPDNVSPGELGCCMSHLKAIKEIYENSDDDYCIIAEDDVSLDLVRYWPFTWTEFFSLLPYDWDCIQMTTICTGDIHVKLHLKFINDFSAAFYLISRHHAAKVLRCYMRGDKWKLDVGVKPRAVSEDTVLVTGIRGENVEYDYKTNTAPGIRGRIQVSPNRTDDFTDFSPKFAINHKLNEKLALFANYSRGNRAPQTTDLYRIQSKQVPGVANS